MMSKGVLEQGGGVCRLDFTVKQIGEKAQEKTVYVGFIDLEVYNRINREAL